MTHHTTWMGRGFHVRYSGRTTGFEVAQVARDAQGDARFCELRWVLHDFSAVEEVTYSPSGIDELAATDHAASLSNPRVRVAVITDRADVVEMARAYVESNLGGYPLRVFPSVGSSRPWLVGIGSY